MKHVFVIPMCVLLLVMGLSGLVCGEETSSHRAYRVTSYHLGTLADATDDTIRQETSGFRPLLITSTVTDILQSELEGTVTWIDPLSNGSNTKGIALSAQIDATDKISLQGVFGVTRNLMTGDTADYENESSWEANLGIIYKFLGNLSYELHFGYMDTGDLFNDRSSYTDVENIIMISNQLSMSF